MTDSFRQLLERADGSAPDRWDPEPGDMLFGTVDRFESFTTEYGELQTCVVIEESTGREVSVKLTHANLRNEFDRQRPQPGERVGLKYFGVRQGKRGVEYRHYLLKVDRGLPINGSSSAIGPEPEFPPWIDDPARAG